MNAPPVTLRISGASPKKAHPHYARSAIKVIHYAPFQNDNSRKDDTIRLAIGINSQFEYL